MVLFILPYGHICTKFFGVLLLEVIYEFYYIQDILFYGILLVAVTVVVYIFLSCVSTLIIGTRKWRKWW